MANFAKFAANLEQEISHAKLTSTESPSCIQKSRGWMAFLCPTPTFLGFCHLPLVTYRVTLLFRLLCLLQSMLQRI